LDESLLPRAMAGFGQKRLGDVDAQYLTGRPDRPRGG
jgi:hypothetical protein